MDLRRYWVIGGLLNPTGAIEFAFCLIPVFIDGRKRTQLDIVVSSLFRVAGDQARVNHVGDRWRGFGIYQSRRLHLLWKFR